MRKIEGKQLLTRALRDINEISAYDPADEEQLEIAGDVLNDLLDELSTDRLFIFAPTIATFPFTAGTQLYKLGNGAAWDSPVPERIERWSVVTAPGTASEREQQRGQPVELASWQGIDRKTQTGEYPRVLFWQRDLDESEHTSLYFWPVPSSAHHARLYMQAAQLRSIKADTTYVLKDGYARTLRMLLIPDLKRAFQRPVSADDKMDARDARRALRRVNRRFPRQAPADPLWTFTAGRNAGGDIREG